MAQVRGDEYFETHRVQVGVAFSQGEEKEMQDRFNVELNKEYEKHGKIDFVGIADGHGRNGETVAIFVVSNLNSVVHAAFNHGQNVGTTSQRTSLASNVKSKIKSLKDKLCTGNQLQAEKPSGAKQIMEAIEEGCLNLDDKLRDAAFDMDCAGNIFDNGGATCCGLWVRENKTYCCNVGHCRIVMSYRGKAVAVTEDHLASKPKEKERIVSAGGLIANNRINGVLNMSRSFGVFSFKNNTFNKRLAQCVIPQPDIYMVDSNYDIDFLVLGSTGIWKLLSNQEVVDFVLIQMKKKLPLQRMASNIIKLCEHKRHMAYMTRRTMGRSAIFLDNLTCAIVIVKSQKPCLAKLMRRSMPVNLLIRKKSETNK